MSYGFLNYIKGAHEIKVLGSFPERILNISSSKGIYIENASKDENGILKFTVSKKGLNIIMENAPNDIIIEKVSSYGIPFFIKRYKKRIALFSLPILFLISSIIYSSFIWKVKIYGAPEAQNEIKTLLKENGVYIGAKKSKIDPYKIKKSILLKSDKLSWMWVDVRGTTANVELRARTQKPLLEKISEPADVIATHSGVIEKMQVFCGAPLVSEGETVVEGQVIISGTILTDNENIPPYYHHASGMVEARVWEEKTVDIPKNILKKTPTKRKKNVYSVNFKKNNIKFSLNSGISYEEYVKIINRVKLPLLPVSFSRTQYREVQVVKLPNNIQKEIEKEKLIFEKELKEKGIQVLIITHSSTESENTIKVTFTAECLMRIDKEIPMENLMDIVSGEENGENN
ncbi:MAG: sporulation protein YqfD [Clostridia bacterium]|nr:sporulation protein YqfD [Clostridia bacterium]